MQASRNGVAVAPPQHWATFMEDEGVELREQVPLAPYTTLGLGGEARYFVECGSEDEVRAALTLAADGRLPVYVLGGGSNVVFLDSGFPGLVLRITIGGVEFRDGESPEVRAGAGVDWDGLVQAVVARGWTGVECLSGIPGTVGGTPIQNVGAYGQEIAESLVSVECLDRTTLERRTFTARECAFACGEGPALERGAVEAFDAHQTLGDLLPVGAHVLYRRPADRARNARQALDPCPAALPHVLHERVPIDAGAGAHLRARPVAQLDPTNGEAQDESGEP